MPQRREAGLTLVEMLVVLAIIGVMGSIAVLGLGGADRNVGLQAEAQRLAASLQLAADDALVSDRPVALSTNSESYSFIQWNSERRQWQEHQAIELAGRHELPKSVRFHPARPGRPSLIAEGTLLVITLSSGSGSWQVRFDGLNANAAPAPGG